MGDSGDPHAPTLPRGPMQHPPHRHVHSEMFCMREGTLELTVNGKTYPLGPGSVGFVRSNDEHGVKNVGTTPANYFVVAVCPGGVWGDRSEVDCGACVYFYGLKIRPYR